MLRQILSFVGAAVLELESGAQVGKVSGFLTDEKGQKILAFLVRPRGFFSKTRVLSPVDIAELGPQFIIIRQIGALLQPEEIAFLPPLLRRRINPLGKPVITPAGKKLGLVSDLAVEVDTFGIVKYYLQPFPLGIFKSYDLVLPAEQILRVETARVIAREEEMKKEPAKEALLETISIKPARD